MERNSAIWHSGRQQYTLDRLDVAFDDWLVLPVVNRAQNHRAGLVGPLGRISVCVGTT